MENVIAQHAYRLEDEYLIELSEHPSGNLEKNDWLKVEIYSDSNQDNFYTFRIYAHDTFYMRKWSDRQLYDRKAIFFEDNGFFSPECDGIRAETSAEAFGYLMAFIRHRLSDPEDNILSPETKSHFVNLSEFL